MAVTPRLLWGTSALAVVDNRALSQKKSHAEMELPHAVQITPFLGANTGWAIPASWLAPSSSLSQPSQCSKCLGVSEEHTWLNTGCNLGALQAGSSEAACSNRHWELDVLTQDPNDVTTGLQWHPYSALIII